MISIFTDRETLTRAVSVNQQIHGGGLNFAIISIRKLAANVPRCCDQLLISRVLTQGVPLIVGCCPSLGWNSGYNVAPLLHHLEQSNMPGRSRLLIIMQTSCIKDSQLPVPDLISLSIVLDYPFSSQL